MLEIELIQSANRLVTDVIGLNQKDNVLVITDAAKHAVRLS